MHQALLMYSQINATEDSGGNTDSLFHPLSVHLQNHPLIPIQCSAHTRLYSSLVVFSPHYSAGLNAFFCTTKRKCNLPTRHKADTIKSGWSGEFVVPRHTVVTMVTARLFHPEYERPWKGIVLCKLMKNIHIYTYTHAGLSETQPWSRYHFKIFDWTGWESMIPFKFFSPTSDSTPNASETAAWSVALCFYIWHCSHPCSATSWRVKSSAVVERGRKVRGWLGGLFTGLFFQKPGFMSRLWPRENSDFC